MTQKLPWSVSRLLNDSRWWGQLQEARKRKQSCGANDELLNKWLRTFGWDVRRYAKCRGLDGRQWYELLRDRAALRDCARSAIRASGGNSEEKPCERTLQYLATLFEDPIQLVIMTDQLWITSLSEFGDYPDRRAVRDLNVLDAIAVSNQLEAARPRVDIGADESADHQIFEFYTENRAVALLGDRWQHGERREILNINLEHSDTRILEEFRQWLKETRARDEPKREQGRVGKTAIAHCERLRQVRSTNPWCSLVLMQICLRRHWVSSD